MNTIMDQRVDPGLQFTLLQTMGENPRTEFWVLAVGDDRFKLKLQVRLDEAYHEQRYATAYVWSKTDLRWNQVYSVEPNIITGDVAVYDVVLALLRGSKMVLV